MSDSLPLSSYSEYWKRSGELAFIKDLNGVYLDVSLPFAKSIGCGSVEEVRGKTGYQLFRDRELVKRYEDDDKRLIDSGKSIENYVEPMSSADETPRYCVTSKYILRDSEGRPAGILGISRDITKEYEAQENYEKELRSLLELPEGALFAVLLDVTDWRIIDNRYRDIRNHIVTHFITADQYFHNACESIIEGDEARDFFGNICSEVLVSMYESGKRGYTMEFLRRMPDREPMWVRAELYFLSDPVNDHLSLVLVLSDIDKKKREYSELIMAAERDPVT